MKRFRLLDSGESTTTAERARRDLHYQRRGRRRRQSHKRHCVQHRSPRSSSVGDVNNIEMDFGRPGGRPLMLIHAQPVCAVSLGHPEDPDLELGGSVLYTNLGGYGALIASPQVLARKLSVWSWDLLAVGQAPSVEGRLGPARSRASDPAACMLGRSRFPTYLPSYPVPARRWRKVYTGFGHGFHRLVLLRFCSFEPAQNSQVLYSTLQRPAPAGTYRTLLTSNNNNRSSSSSSRSGNSQSVNLNKTTAPTRTKLAPIVLLPSSPPSIESIHVRNPFTHDRRAAPFQ